MNTRTERFDMTLTCEEKAFFLQAARLAGYSSLSQFVRVVVKQKAEDIYLRQKQILATKRDRNRFFKMLDNPPEPNEALVDLLK